MRSVDISNYNAQFHPSINYIAEEEWNRLCGTDYPFLRHEFFSALENSGSTSTETGWQPHHLTLSDTTTQKIIAVMPLFIKTHSYGEYMFDWAWADAYRRHGFDYYPKLVNAIPFTPATGKRWGIDDAYSIPEIIEELQLAIHNEAHEKDFSSCHILFLTEKNRQQWNNKKWLARVGYQYHWFNNDHTDKKYYSDFNDFLSTMSSRKRKNIRKEREKIVHQGISLTIKTGDQLSLKEWQQFHHFYQSTYYKRSGHQGYLSPSFFPVLAKAMGESIIVIQAFDQSDNMGEEKNKNNSDWVAAALCFKDSETLYGRYWGCADDYDGLHFEACYYQGIEYAIKHKLIRFDPGAQGEHKIQRGFTPITTHSSHWIEHTEFSQAIARFLTQEEKEVQQYLLAAAEHLPFKKE
ncbi:GNAT family N-acetyltransferase [Eionea flava]